jgi:hypothetical protein
MSDPHTFLCKLCVAMVDEAPMELRAGGDAIIYAHPAWLYALHMYHIAMVPHDKPSAS